MTSQPTQDCTHTTQVKKMTCTSSHVIQVYARTTFNNVGLQLLNHLPRHIKEIPILYKFRNALKTYLLDHCFYRVNEFLSHGTYSSSNQV
jgi:hypothetical protein